MNDLIKIAKKLILLAELSSEDFKFKEWNQDWYIENWVNIVDENTLNKEFKGLLEKLGTENRLDFVKWLIKQKWYKEYAEYVSKSEEDDLFIDKFYSEFAVELKQIQKQNETNRREKNLKEEDDKLNELLNKTPQELFQVGYYKLFNLLEKKFDDVIKRVFKNDIADAEEFLKKKDTMSDGDSVDIYTTTRHTLYESFGDKLQAYSKTLENSDKLTMDNVIDSILKMSNENINHQSIHLQNLLNRFFSEDLSGDRYMIGENTSADDKEKHTKLINKFKEILKQKVKLNTEIKHRLLSFTASMLHDFTSNEQDIKEELIQLLTVPVSKSEQHKYDKIEEEFSYRPAFMCKLLKHLYRAKKIDLQDIKRLVTHKQGFHYYDLSEKSKSSIPDCFRNDFLTEADLKEISGNTRRASSLIKIAKELSVVFKKIASVPFAVDENVIKNLKKMFNVEQKLGNEIVVVSWTKDESDEMNKDDYVPNVEYMFEFSAQRSEQPKENFSYTIIRKESDLDFLKNVARTINFSDVFADNYVRIVGQ